MPIAFVLNGVNLILLFVGGKFNKNIFLFTCYLFFSIVSYISEWFLLGNVYINFFEVVSLLFLLFYLFKNKKFLQIRYVLISIVVVIIMLHIEIGEITFGFLNLSFVYDAYIVLYVCLCVFDNLIYFTRRGYEKINSISIINCFDNRNLLFS